MQSIELTEKALDYLKGVFTAFDKDGVREYCFRLLKNKMAILTTVVFTIRVGSLVHTFTT